MNEEWFGPWCVVAPLFVSRPAASCPLQEEKTQKPSWKSQAAKNQKGNPPPRSHLLPVYHYIKGKVLFVLRWLVCC